MNARDAARLALEGNPVFTDLRLQRDVLKEQNVTLMDAMSDFCNEHLDDLTPEKIADYRARFREVMRGEDNAK